MDHKTCLNLLSRGIPSEITLDAYHHAVVTVVYHITCYHNPNNLEFELWSACLDRFQIDAIMSYPDFIQIAISVATKDILNPHIRQFLIHPQIIKSISSFIHNSLTLTGNNPTSTEWAALYNFIQLCEYTDTFTTIIKLGQHQLNIILELNNPSEIWTSLSMKSVLQNILTSLVQICKMKSSLFQGNESLFQILFKLLKMLHKFDDIPAVNEPDVDVSLLNLYSNAICTLIINMIRQEPRLCLTLSVVTDILPSVSSTILQQQCVALALLHALLTLPKVSTSVPVSSVVPLSNTTTITTTSTQYTKLNSEDNTRLHTHTQHKDTAVGLATTATKSKSKVIGTKGKIELGVVPVVKSTSNNKTTAAISTHTPPPTTSTSTAKKGVTITTNNNSKKASDTHHSKTPSQISKEFILCDLIRSGYMHGICWALICHLQIVRITAFKTLSSIDNLGLVPILEMVTAGRLPVYKKSGGDEAVVDGAHSGKVAATTNTTTTATTVIDSNRNIDRVRDIFPEVEIRKCADDIVCGVASHMHTDVYLRQQCLSTLQHTGHLKLRLNILSGILFLCGRVPELGRLLWFNTEANNNESDDNNKVQKRPGHNAFRETVTLSVNEHHRGHLRPLLKLMLSILEKALLLQQSSNVMKDDKSRQHQPHHHNHSPVKSSSLSQSHSSAATKGSLQERLEGGPTVAVAENSDKCALLVKMQCPAPTAVRTHSPELASMLQDETDDQCNDNSHSNANVLSSSSLSLSQSLQSLPRLEGSYLAWQESSVGRLSVDMLCDLYCIATRFNMCAELRSVCTEAGMYAIRSRRKSVSEKDFLDSINKVIEEEQVVKGYQKFSSTPKYMMQKASNLDNSIHPQEGFTNHKPLIFFS
eukprot:gene4824-9620_t